MCFFFKTSEKVKQMLEQKYEGIEEVFKTNSLYSEERLLNGFNHPNTLVVANDEPAKVQMMNWGLMPSWAKDRSFQKSTLNARFETIKEKPSFKNYINNRCLIFAEGFYEWQWLDAKGKSKQKYLLTIEDEQPFAFAGIWSEWSDNSTGEKLKTFSIITTQANQLMSEIHNTKKRMPIIIEPSHEKSWLDNGTICLWNDKLTATKI